MNALELEKKLIKARNGIEQETAKIIIKMEKKIIDLVRIDQLYDKGIDGKGKKIKPEYTNYTVAVKKIKGDVSNHVTLHDTGDLYDSFITDYGSYELYLFPTDKKKDELLNKYGGSIFDMTIDNKFKLNYEMILPELQKFVKSTIA